MTSKFVMTRSLHTQKFALQTLSSKNYNIFHKYLTTKVVKNMIILNSIHIFGRKIIIF